MGNPGFWGDYPLWGDAPYWLNRKESAAALALRLTCAAVLRAGLSMRGASTLAVSLSAVTESGMSMRGGTALPTGLSATLSAGLSGGTDVPLSVSASYLPVADMSAAIFSAAGLTADMAVALAGELPLALSSQAALWPIIPLRGSLGLYLTPTAAETERLGPVSKQAFWGGGYRSLTYQSGLAVPPEADGATLKLMPHLESGSIARLEYGYGKIQPFWPDSPLWGGAEFWGVPREPEEWLLWKNGLVVQAGEYIFVRLVTGKNAPARICELEWIFDVEDAELSLDDVSVPAGGLRLNLPAHYFRWISVISFGLQYIQSEAEALRPAWMDKGVIEDGGVAQGPFIVCLDERNNMVPGSVDIRLQGARGKKYPRP